MNPSRRALLTHVGGAVLPVAVCFAAAYLLPDGGVLGLVGTVLGFIGVVVALALPFAIWRAISPAAASRWDANPDEEPLPVAVPIFWWVLVGGVAWILTVIEAPTTVGDYILLVLLWCGLVATVAFAVVFSRRYLRDRRRSA